MKSLISTVIHEFEITEPLIVQFDIIALIFIILAICCEISMEMLNKISDNNNKEQDKKK